MADYLQEDEYIDFNTNVVVKDAFETGKNSHKEAIEAEMLRR